jgi:hypothetical protein
VFVLITVAVAADVVVIVVDSSQTVDEKNKHLASEDCEQPRKTVRDFEKDRETL